ncbi:hypothetical protein [Acinetobacter variabilis]|uniref:hypothetical protein n=1 Tax=Acinetobacter variabilis TaxID=70346 RepID=UPI0030F804D8
MSDFKGYWKNYEDENYVLGSEEYCAEQAWNHQQAIIEDLKAQLNNMEACYIEKKKEVEAVQHQKSLQELEISQISQANQEWQKINGELAKALRGAND